MIVQNVGSSMDLLHVEDLTLSIDRFGKRPDVNQFHGGRNYPKPLVDTSSDSTKFMAGHTSLGTVAAC